MVVSYMCTSNPARGRGWLTCTWIVCLCVFVYPRYSTRNAIIVCFAQASGIAHLLEAAQNFILNTIHPP